MTIKTVAILLGEHPCIMNIFLGPVTVHYREVLLYAFGRGEGVTKKSTLCTLVKMMTIMDDP